MKIICDDQKEYDELMRASKYIHDFRVYIENKNGETKIAVSATLREDEDNMILKNNEDVMYCLNSNIDMVNVIMHLYCVKSDWPDKDKYITIRDKKNTFKDLFKGML